MEKITQEQLVIFLSRDALFSEGIGVAAQACLNSLDSARMTCAPNHITRLQLERILDDNVFRWLDPDMQIWDDLYKNLFISEYLNACNQDSVDEIFGEATMGINIGNLYKDSYALAEDIRGSIYNYLEADLRDLVSEILTEAEQVNEQYKREDYERSLSVQANI